MSGRYFGPEKPNMLGRNSVLAERNFHAFSSEIVKPSISADHPHQYNLSPMDQTMFRNYMPIVFFYQTSSEKVSEKSRRLKHSLAKTLGAYYPFAGRLVKSKACVDCNDEGVEFQESRVNCTLSEFVKKYEEDFDLEVLFPLNSVYGTFDNDSSLVIVRLNYLDCGGVAIAICMSHIIGDGTTVSNFMNYWAAMTRQSGDQVSPHIISSLSCNDNFVEISIPPALAILDYSIPATRFVFMNSELTKLKAKVRSSDGQNPTRFEFLSGLFYKCLMAVEKSRSGLFTPSTLTYSINMRSKLALPKSTFGNWVCRSTITSRTESESSWNGVLDEMKTAKTLTEGLKDLDENKLKSTHGEIIQDKYKMYHCSALCNMDLDKANFGWGNPIRVALPIIPVSGGVYTFLDTPCSNGIEVVMIFEEPEMLKFELSKEIDVLTSLNNLISSL